MIRWTIVDVPRNEDDSFILVAYTHSKAPDYPVTKEISIFGCDDIVKKIEKHIPHKALENIVKIASTPLSGTYEDDKDPRQGELLLEG